MTKAPRWISLRWFCPPGIRTPLFLLRPIISPKPFCLLHSELNLLFWAGLFILYTLLSHQLCLSHLFPVPSYNSLCRTHAEALEGKSLSCFSKMDYCQTVLTIFMISRLLFGSIPACHLHTHHNLETQACRCYLLFYSIILHPPPL